MTYWDCHSHLSFLSTSEAEEIVKRSPLDLSWILGGYQPSEWEAQVALKKCFPQRIKTCYGLHPWFVRSDEFNPSLDLEALKIWSDQADFIGEVGLDFFGDASLLKKQTQIEVFEKQLDITKNKPFVFHFVQSHGTALEILKNHKVKGLVHSFSGPIEVAEQYIDQNLHLSFGPGILNEKFINARNSLKNIPIESILIESDTPSNVLDDEDPLKNLEQVYKEAALLRDIDIIDLKAQVQKNLQSLL